MNKLISQLLISNTEQEDIIRKQASIIDEMFTLICQYANMDELEGLEPLLNDIKDVSTKGLP